MRETGDRPNIADMAVDESAWNSSVTGRGKRERERE